MIVTAALSWFDEPPEMLDACVRSCAVIADRIVALDGAYVRFPGATVASPPAQAETIRAAAEAVGMECNVVTVDHLWAGQVEKRTRLMELATAGSDWVVIVDADYVLHGVRDAARRVLETSYFDTMEVAFYTPVNDNRPIEESGSSLWHAALAGRTIPIPLIFRALPGMRVEKKHWWYSALKGGERVWLWDGDGSYAKIEHGQLPAPFYIEHVCLTRDTKHVLSNRGFINDRMNISNATGQEDDVPGWPQPVYDYKSRTGP